MSEIKSADFNSEIDHIIDLVYYGEKHFLKGCYENRKESLRNAIKKADRGDLMTKLEILNALEALKDSTNENGKKSIDGIKAHILQNLAERLELPLQTVDSPPPYIPQEGESIWDNPSKAEAVEFEPPKPKEKTKAHATKSKSKFKSGGRFADK